MEITQFQNKVFCIVKEIPRGRVLTYKKISILLGNKNWARAVGNALHNNKNQFLIPCYRVVNAKGKLSISYAFGGIDEQKRLLENDGIKVVNYGVDIEKSL